jgi:hypothetical protein
MCQLCEEANLYLAQLEAAERKAADAKTRNNSGGKTGQAPGRPAAAPAAGAK